MFIGHDQNGTSLETYQVEVGTRPVKRCTDNWREKCGNATSFFAPEGQEERGVIRDRFLSVLPSILLQSITGGWGQNLFLRFNQLYEYRQGLPSFYC